MSRPKLTAGAKLLLGLFFALCAINLVDYFFHGRQSRDLVAAAGLALMAYGTCRNGNRSRPDADDPGFDKTASRGCALGAFLVLGDRFEIPVVRSAATSAKCMQGESP